MHIETRHAARPDVDGLWLQLNDKLVTAYTVISGTATHHETGLSMPLERLGSGDWIMLSIERDLFLKYLEMIDD